MHLVEDSAVARGMIRVETGEDLIVALEKLAAAAGWTEAFVTGAGALEMVELARGGETMTFDNAQLSSLSGRIVRRGDRCEAALQTTFLAGGTVQAGRIVAAITGELLLVVDAAIAKARPKVEPPRERLKSEAPVDSDDERAATRPLSQSFTTKPVIVPRGQAEASEEDSNDHWMDVEAGDTLEHPQLGACEVVGEDESGGMRVRIASGRICVLRLDTLEVRAPSTSPEGQRTFRVAGPKRRR